MVRRPDAGPSDPRRLGYVLTRKSIVPQVSNEKVYKKLAYGLTWPCDPVRKDRLSVKPVVWNGNEWAFDEECSRYEQCAPIRGEWGQIQSRHILAEADVEEINAAHKAVQDVKRVLGLVQHAVGKYADDLALGDGQSRNLYAEDVALLRSFDIWLHSNNRSLSGNLGGGWDIDTDEDDG